MKKLLLIFIVMNLSCMQLQQPCAKIVSRVPNSLRLMRNLTIKPVSTIDVFRKAKQLSSNDDEGQKIIERIKDYKSELNLHKDAYNLNLDQAADACNGEYNFKISDQIRKLMHLRIDNKHKQYRANRDVGFYIIGSTTALNIPVIILYLQNKLGVIGFDLLLILQASIFSGLAGAAFLRFGQAQIDSMQISRKLVSEAVNETFFTTSGDSKIETAYEKAKELLDSQAMPKYMRQGLIREFDKDLKTILS